MLLHEFVDLPRGDGCVLLLQAIDAWGTLDVLVNNAGPDSTVIVYLSLSLFFNLRNYTSRCNLANTHALYT